MASVDTAGNVRARPMTAEEKKVILASSAGTVFECMTSIFTDRSPR